MTTPNSYRDWFKTTVANSDTDPMFAGGLDIKDFYYADSGRLIEATRSKIEYPCLVLEVPTYFFPTTFTSDYKARMRGAFSIVKGCTLDDYEAQDNAMNTCMRIGIRLLKKLKDTMKPQGAWFDGDAIIEPVLSLIVDNNYGYRFEFSISGVYLYDISPC
jgi:hypothetical protein